MLQSKLFATSQRLSDCQSEDSAHVTPGQAGDHVARIQQALLRIDNADIAPNELKTALYGDSTAAAVLRYKSARSIINRTYQSSPDNIVGRMTIASLDKEMLPLEECVTDEFSGGALRPLAGRLG